LRAERRAGLVVSVGRNAVWLALDGEDAFRSAMLPKREVRVALAPGDRVEALLLDEGKAIVDGRLPRSSKIERRTAGGRTKTMAANVNALAVVAAFSNPPLSFALIDEILAVAELNEVQGIVVFTKPDLAEEALRRAAPELYRSLGYAAFVLNPKSGEHVDRLAADLRARRALLIGQSGVGKSSIYRALGGTGTTIGDLSKAGQGRQTTTSARLHRFPAGFLIDSPGIGEFALTGLPPRELAEGFREFAAYSGKCRFRDCSHRDDPSCAVRAAADSRAIAASRYASFRAILSR
jgi:ribosome biogenesis GTPase